LFQPNYCWIILVYWLLWLRFFKRVLAHATALLTPKRCCTGKPHLILGFRIAPYIYINVCRVCGFRCLPPPVAELRREDLVFRTITGIRSYPKEVYRSHFAQCIQDLCPYNPNLALYLSTLAQLTDKTKSTEMVVI
jgi:hypothetical protein